MATRRVPFEPGLLEALAAASSAAELGQYSDRITTGSLFQLRAIQRSGRPATDPNDVKALLDVACHALDLIEQHLSTGAAAATAAPPPTLPLPPGATFAAGSLLCVATVLTEKAYTEQHPGPLGAIVCASKLPQRLAGACAAVSKAITSSSSSHEAAPPAAGATDSRLLERSGTPFLLANMLSTFAGVADVASRRSRVSIPGDSSTGIAVLSNPHLLAAARAAAGLALAVLRSQALLSCSAQALETQMQRVLHSPTSLDLPLALCAVLAINSILQTPFFPPRGMPSSEDAALFMQLSHEPAVQQTVLLHAALAVAVFHEHRHGTLPVRAPAGAAAAAGGGGSQPRARQLQQQQQGQRLLVPPFHQQLLQALGMADVVLAGQWDGHNKFRRIVTSDLGPGGSSGSGGCEYVNSAMGLLELACNRVDSFAASPTMQHLACPALLLRVEAAALAPESRPADTCLGSCGNLLLRLRATARATAAGGGLPVVPQELLLTVLQAVLTLLLPAVRHALKQGSSDADADDWGRRLGLIVMLATGLAMDAAGAAGTADEASAALPLVDLMLQHTSDYCSLLEAAVRDLQNSEGSALLLSTDAWRLLLDPDAAGRLATAVHSRGGAQLAALLADEAAALQLFALAVSCIKGSDQSAAGGGAAACLRQLWSFVVAAAPLAPRSTRLLALLAGRCLVALGGAALEPGGIEYVQPGWLEDLAGLLAWLAEAVLPDAGAWAAVSGPAAAADPAARLRLLEAARQLRQHLAVAQHLQQQLGTSNRATAEVAAAAGVVGPDGQAYALVVGVPVAQLRALAPRCVRSCQAASAATTTAAPTWLS